MLFAFPVQCQWLHSSIHLENLVIARADETIIDTSSVFAVVVSNGHLARTPNVHIAVDRPRVLGNYYPSFDGFNRRPKRIAFGVTVSVIGE